MKDRSCEHCTAPIPEDVRSDARFCSQRCQKAAWERSRECSRCGGSRWAGREHCRPCENEIRTLARETRLEDVALMWDAGMAQSDIARELGYGPNSNPPQLSELMRRGRIQARREGVRRKHEERAA